MSPRLKREAGIIHVVFYGLGTIFGAGIYALIGTASGLTGNSLWLSFILAAFIASLTALSYAELSSMMPKSAAEYVYTKRAFSSRSFSFSLSWFIIFATSIAAATVALGFGGYFNSIFGTPIILNAVVLLVLLSGLNILGIDQSMKANMVFTSITIFGLLIIIYAGIGSFGSVNYFDMSQGISGVLSAAAFIFFAFLGFEDIVNIAEETKNPRKIIPKALILCLIIATIIYVLVALSVVSLMPWQELSKSNAPLSDSISNVMPGAPFFMSIIALFATASTVLIFTIASSRMVYGLTKDHSLPKIFSYVDPKTKTPVSAILIITFVAILFVIMGDIKFVASITDFGAFLTFFFVNASLIVLRIKEPNMIRIFKVPFNIKNIPLPTVIGTIFCFVMLFHFNFNVVLLSLGVMFTGFAFYKFLDEINDIVMGAVNTIKKIRKNGKKKQKPSKLDMKIYREIKREQQK